MASSTTPSNDDQKKPLSENERVRKEILDTLARLGELGVQDDGLIFEGQRIILPEQMRGRPQEAVEFIEQWIEDQEQKYSFVQFYKYRPWDGAAAFQRAMKKVFGTRGIGQATFSLFGVRPPQYVSISTGLNQQEQIPWGKVHFGPLDAVFTLDSEVDEEAGLIFELTVTAPKKYKGHVDAFLQVIEEELRTASIYRGKAINAATEPGFLNTAAVDPAKVIYSDEVMTQLEANVWSLLRYSDTMREVELPLKRQVLLYGPYGTGKTLAGLLTAQIAEQNGWTYIQVRSGEDDLFEALQTAQLYAPAVVMFEDIDQLTPSTDRDVAKLLDKLDSVANKGAEVLAVFTTNHPDRLHRGMMRPGRLDAVIELAGMDINGIKRLIQAHIPVELLSSAIDWEQVFVAFEGLLPSFAKEAVDRAKRYGIARTGGMPEVVTTADLVGAAQGIRMQERMMAGAPEVQRPDSLDVAFSAAMDQRLRQHVVIFPNGTPQAIEAQKD